MVTALEDVGMPEGRSSFYQLMKIAKAMAIFAHTFFGDVYGRNWVDIYMAYTYFARVFLFLGVSRMNKV